MALQVRSTDTWDRCLLFAFGQPTCCADAWHDQQTTGMPQCSCTPFFFASATG